MWITESAPKRLAWVAFALCCVFFAADAMVALLSGPRAESSSGSGVADVALSIIVLSFPLAGILITRRQPRHRIGWLMLGIGLIAFPTDFYVDYGLRVRPGSLPGVEVVAALTAASWAPVLGLVGTFLILLFPDGHLPSRRWRFVGWFSGAAIAYVYVMLTLFPGQIEAAGMPPFDNPLGIQALGNLENILLPTIIVLPISMVLCAAALVQRFRRSRGVERLQLKWLASAGAVVGFLYLITMVASLLHGTEWSGGDDPFWLAAIQQLAVFSFVLIPVAIGVAILKHGLYEIDVAINKALVFGTLASFITAVYVAIVVGVGSLVGRGDQPNLALSIAATAIVAVAFQPVRDRVQRLANRLVYGVRATPYEVLSNFADRVGGSYEAAEVLPMMARTVAQGVGASRVDVWLAIGSGLSQEATWPEVAPVDSESLTTSVDTVADLRGDRVVPVRHQGELLGVLTVTKPPGENVTPAEDKLLDDVAGQAGLVLRNVRLIEELRSSRQRLVTTQDEERRRLERDLHDGAQQSLVSVALIIRTVRARLGAGGAPAGAALDHASEQLRLAIEELRELARGIHPAILTERGLGAALRSLAERSPVPVVVDYQLNERPESSVEATLYFVVAEALTNVAKYAQAGEVTVTVARSGDVVTLDVNDDGVGGADQAQGSGLRGLADRLAVVDGTMDIHSPAAGGTRLSCRIPMASSPSRPEVVRDLSETRTTVGVGQ